MAAFQSGVRMFDGVMYIAVVVVGALFMIDGQITMADLMAYLLYVTTLLTSIRRIVEFTEQFQRGMTGIERFDEIMRAPIEIKDEPDAAVLGGVEGDIRFEKVSFRYSDDQGEVLSDIDLHVKRGDNIALVGPSGGGKTTLCSLIPRFTRSPRGAFSSTGGTSKLSRRSLCASTSALFSRTSTSSPARSTRTSPTASRARAAKRWRRRRRQAGARIYPGAARGVRHLRRRARGQAFGRAEAAHQHRPRLSQESPF